MFGYATDETKECMPLTLQLAHGMNKKIAALRRDEIKEAATEIKGAADRIKEAACTQTRCVTRSQTPSLTLISSRILTPRWRARR